MARRRRYTRPDWADEFEAYGHKIAPDGTIVVYHATTAAKAQKITEEGFLRRPANAPDSYGVYFSISPEVAENYGDGTLVKLRVPVEDLGLDDIFPSTGRMDFHARTYQGIYIPIEVKAVEAEPNPGDGRKPWYHGGGPCLSHHEDHFYVTDDIEEATYYADMKDGKVYLLRPEYDELVHTAEGHSEGIIMQRDVKKHGGFRRLFELGAVPDNARQQPNPWLAHGWVLPDGQYIQVAPKKDHKSAAASILHMRDKSKAFDRALRERWVRVGDATIQLPSPPDNSAFLRARDHVRETSPAGQDWGIRIEWWSGNDVVSYQVPISEFMEMDDIGDLARYPKAVW